MPLGPGAKLGPYEVLSLLGAGGMGEVYRARDTRLDRTVAIKVLPAEVAGSPDRRARFEREAHAISSLNHPHICTLHDVGQQDGVDYLVMEYVEGQSLAERLGKGPLLLEHVLRCGIEIADALDKAHRAGIVHRDLKPGNVMLTKAGVKLLDFGLAKLRAGAGGGHPTLSAVPTEEKPMTGEGAILGTIPYMAPEQLEGKEADARADLWALGTLLYEMATGRRPFEGKSQASLIAAILERQPPPISTLQPMSPPALDRLARTCLKKDPDERWQNAHDLGAELRWILESALPTEARAGGAVTQPGRRFWSAAASVLMGIAIGALVTWAAASRPKSSAPTGHVGVARFAIGLPSVESISLRGRGRHLALSPDGRWIAFCLGQTKLAVRPVDGLEFRSVQGTEGAYELFFSPDSQWLGYTAYGKLWKVAVGGGTPVAICDAHDTRGGAWGANGTIWFTPSARSGLWRVPAGGGAPTLATTPDAAKGEISHRWPELIPGREAILFTIKTASLTSFDDAEIAVLDLASGRRETVLKGGFAARYVSTGHLVFMRAGRVMAVPFDVKQLRVTGPPVAVLDGVMADLSAGASQFAVSADGLLVYIPGKGRFAERRLTWVDRQGRAEPIGAPARQYSAVRVSPDGKTLAVAVDAANNNVWTYDLARGTTTRLTFGAGNRDGPVWSPDGSRIAFGAEHDGPWNVTWQAANGSGAEERLANSPQIQSPGSWSPDGRSLVFMQMDPVTKYDLWLLPLEGDRHPRVLLQTPYNEGHGRISPDGRWITWVSDESGRPEVYVGPFPRPGMKSQVSAEGGQEPVWAPDGREIFYWMGDAFMSVAVATTGSRFQASPPRRLFEGRYFRVGLDLFPVAYDVMPDGRRFVMVKDDEEAAPTQLHVVLNWFQDLQQRLRSH